MKLSTRLALLTLLAAARVASAQAVLRLPSSTRALGMGNVAIAGRDDDVLFYNPAQLVIARGMSLSMERLTARQKTGSLSSVVRFNTGGIAVGGRLVDVETPIFRLDPLNGLLIPDTASGRSAEAVVALAQVFKSVRWGVAAKYVGDIIGGSGDGRMMFDLGLSRDFFRFYTIGLSAQHISTQSAPTTRPRFTGGAATARALGPYDVVATTAVVVDTYGGTTHVAPAGGVEVGWSWISGYSIAGRLGARSPLAGEQALTAGAGFNADRLSIDYALETLTGSRVAHRIGLRIR